MTLQGRIALVTGASRGIGAAAAAGLAEAGAHVILTARNKDALKRVEDRILEDGGSASIEALDLTERGSIASLAASVHERWGKLDILILNAAMLGRKGTVAFMDEKEFSRTFALNLFSQQAMIASFHELLRASDRAMLIAVTAGVGRSPRAFWGAYGSSKAALENLLLSYSQEVGPATNIRVAILDPGPTATEMRARAFPGEDQANLRAPSTVADRILELVNNDFVNGLRV